ncbi:hypothetical protein A45J_0999 [hot springs metagenome]|uniref:Uncharacterized protein n=1 Tax=hot springs metagenome TaxID=433727 RepID=A0A5J4L0I3_9ZZZZ
MSVRDKLKALREGYIKTLPAKLNGVNSTYSKIKGNRAIPHTYN